jgi:hypothetical protein
MKTMVNKIIEISGYTKATKTALWTGSTIEEVTNYNIDDYSFTDEKIESELIKAQIFIDNQVKENNWIINPKAFINTFELK